MLKYSYVSHTGLEGVDFFFKAPELRSVGIERVWSLGKENANFNKI